MTSETMFKGLGIGLVAGLVVVLILLFAREHKRAEQLASTQRLVCLHRQGVLEAILAGNTVTQDLHAQIRFETSDTTVLKMCLGAEIPVSLTKADACWILNGDVMGCYKEPLYKLLVLYRQRRNEY